MLFQERLQKIEQELSSEVKKLIKIAIDKQNHNGNLLLVYLNCWYESDSNGESKYQIGHGTIGLSDITHYKFIDSYRRNINVRTSTQEFYHKMEDIDSEFEEFTVSIEMLIYLKIWENDMFLKTWYQFLNILSGIDYDWEFKLKDFNNDEGISNRPDLIRNVFKDGLSNYSEAIKEHINIAYKQQVRNAIAHSNYYFFGRQITLTNYNCNDKYNIIEKLTYEDWYSMFHSAIMIHNSYLLLKSEINNYYTELYKETRNPIEVVCNHNSQTIIANYIKNDNDEWVSID